MFGSRTVTTCLLRGLESNIPHQRRILYQVSQLQLSLRNCPICDQTHYIVLLITGFCLLSAVLCQIGGGSPPTYSRSLETALRTELFTGYSVLQRPEDRMRVKVSLTLLTVNDMVTTFLFFCCFFFSFFTYFFLFIST